MATTTLQTLTQDAAARLGWWSGLLTPSSGTTTSFVVDGTSAPVDTGDADTLYQDGWCRIESDSAGTPLNVGDARRVRAFTPATSTFELYSDRGFDNAITATQRPSIYRVVPPTQQGEQLGWREYVNRILTSVCYRRYGLLTLVTDGDMSASGATNWTNSNLSTMAKVTTAANVAFGPRSLHCVNNSIANGYARSATVSVTAGDSYDLVAALQTASGTGHLVAYNETTGADIESESSTGRDWRLLAFTFTVPSGCSSISVRLRGAETTADLYWGLVSLRHQQGRRLALPSWIEGESDIEALEWWTPVASQNDAYQWSSLRSGGELVHRLVADPLGATPWLVEWRPQLPNHALLYLRGLSVYDELTAYTDTTVAPAEMVLSGACLEALLDITQRTEVKDSRLARYQTIWQRHQAKLPRRRRLIRGVFG